MDEVVAIFELLEETKKEINKKSKTYLLLLNFFLLDNFREISHNKYDYTYE